MTALLKTFELSETFELSDFEDFKEYEQWEILSNIQKDVKNSLQFLDKALFCAQLQIDLWKFKKFKSRGKK